jgi:Mycothiol maleylpyruvate isomerase N-terminal domain
MNGRDILTCAEACVSVLAPTVAMDWTASVPGLDFSVASVIAHAAATPLWYSVDLWGGPDDSAAFKVEVNPEAANAAILTSLMSAARVCAASVESAPDNLRGFHPFGSPDPSGYAAMACDELLIHGDDAARGLTPPAGIAEQVLARLYPWHDVDGDPWETLQWANGRIELAGRPSQQRWRWHSAPLAEWDGTVPNTVG